MCSANNLVHNDTRYHIKAKAFHFSDDHGKLLENVVATINF